MKNFKPSFLSTKQALCIVLGIIFLCFLLNSKPVHSEELKVPEIVFEQGKITEIKDGDTFEVNINGEDRTCRLLGIDTPEKFKGKKLNNDVNKTGVKKIVHLEAGAQASEYAKNYFEQRFSPDVWVHVFKKDLYGRDLCIVASQDLSPTIEDSYNCHVLLDGYAVFYKGGKDLKKIYRDEFKKCDLREDGLYKTFPVLMDKLRN